MYRLVSGNKVVGNFEKLLFTRYSPTGKCYVPCEKQDAEGVEAGGKSYSISGSEHYSQFDEVAVIDLDGEIVRSAELDYIRAMNNMV